LTRLHFFTCRSLLLASIRVSYSSKYTISAGPCCLIHSLPSPLL